MAFCTKCGAFLEEDETFCGKCGAAAEPKAAGKRCGFCGNLVEEELSYCSYCGADLSEDGPQEGATPAPPAARAEGADNPYYAPPAGGFPADHQPGARQEPVGPEQELYRRARVTMTSSKLYPTGVLVVTTHRLQFTPAKIHITAKPVELPISRIATAQTAKTIVAIPGSIKVLTVEGKSYTFTFGAVFAAEANRAAAALEQAIAGTV